MQHYLPEQLSCQVLKILHVFPPSHSRYSQYRVNLFAGVGLDTMSNINLYLLQPFAWQLSLTNNNPTLIHRKADNIQPCEDTRLIRELISIVTLVKLHQGEGPGSNAYERGARVHHPSQADAGSVGIYFLAQ